MSKKKQQTEQKQDVRETPPAAEVELEEMMEALTAAQDEAAENRDHYLRAKAEMENLRKRTDTERANVQKYAIERFVTELLAVKDSLELAQSVDLGDENQDAAEKMQEGLSLTLKQLESVFEKFSLETIDPQGEKFDPERHQAMSMLESMDIAPNHIINVIQKGYLLKDRVIRPALVVVAKAASTAAGQAKPEGDESPA